MMLRSVTPADANAICEIYNHYVQKTTISFEESPVSPEEMRRRITETTATLPWLVIEANGIIVGYAYASKWKARDAYRFSVESTVYVNHALARQGYGKKLYSALISELEKRSIHRVMACIAQPNVASVALHESFGFVKAAHFHEIGRKFNRWIDVGYWQLALTNVTSDNETR